MFRALLESFVLWKFMYACKPNNSKRKNEKKKKRKKSKRKKEIEEYEKKRGKLEI